MSKKENLNKALFDMFGVGNDPAANAAKEPAEDLEGFDMFDLDGDLDGISAEDAAPATDFEEPAAAEPAPAPVQAAPAYTAPAAYAPASTPAPMPVAPRQPAASGAITYLAPGTVMEGSLSAQGDVQIEGDFKGDISATGGVILRTNMNGNISAARLEIYSSTLVGDVRASESVSVDGASAITGGIYAQDVVCAGKVKGDLVVTGNTTLLSGAAVEGAITTDTIVIERGAAASGLLTMGAAKR